MTQFPMSEGRITCTNGTYTYEYQMKDHLGNVRASFTCASGAPVMQQEDYYYPFGLSFRMQDAASANRYLYNGKEKEDFHNLGWNDYGARFYDPQLGRWHAMDPDNQYISTYTYVGNNPIRLVDKDGKDGNLPDDQLLQDPVSYNMSAFSETTNNLIWEIKTTTKEYLPKVTDVAAFIFLFIDPSGASSTALNIESLVFQIAADADENDLYVSGSTTAISAVTGKIVPALAKKLQFP